MEISGIASYLSKILGTEITLYGQRNISYWNDWYKGYYRPFHHYVDFNGNDTIELDRYTLKMGKRVCEEWANLLLNEKMKISAGGGKGEKFLKKVLKDNGFFKNANTLVEKAFALGTGAFVVRLSGGEIKLDYITAECIIPISSETGKIKEVCFASEFVKKGKRFTYLELHLLDRKKNYFIRNICLDEGLREVKLPGVPEKYETGGKTPWFYIITPNIANNENVDSGMGISVFANAIDVLKGIDLAFDNMLTDFYLGGKMVVMNESVIAKEQDGRRVAPFHSKKRLFMSIGDSIVDGKLFEEYNPELRVDENSKGIKLQLALLCTVCGLGNNYFSFDNNEIKTATEVISEHSELFRTIKKHELVLEDALTGLFECILRLGGFKEDVTITFDDSIIEDKKSLREQDREDVKLGIMTGEEYRQKYYEH